jgi:hypothetical protein
LSRGRQQNLRVAETTSCLTISIGPVLVLAQLETFSAPHQIRQLSKVQETRYPSTGRVFSMSVLDPEPTFLEWLLMVVFGVPAV